MAVKTMTGFTQNEIDYMRETARIKAELDYQSGMTNAKRQGRKEGLELFEQGLTVDEIKERFRDS